MPRNQGIKCLGSASYKKSVVENVLLLQRIVKQPGWMARYSFSYDSDMTTETFFPPLPVWSHFRGFSVKFENIGMVLFNTLMAPLQCSLIFDFHFCK